MPSQMLDVSGNSMATVQTSNEIYKTGKTNANASQNKKSCNATHKPTQIAAHFILPNTQTALLK